MHRNILLALVIYMICSSVHGFVDLMIVDSSTSSGLPHFPVMVFDDNNNAVSMSSDENGKLALLKMPPKISAPAVVKINNRLEEWNNWRREVLNRWGSYMISTVPDKIWPPQVLLSNQTSQCQLNIRSGYMILPVKSVSHAKCKVVDSYGQPIKGISVQIYSQSRMQIYITDSNGEIDVPFYAGGDYDAGDLDEWYAKIHFPRSLVFLDTTDYTSLPTNEWTEAYGTDYPVLKEFDEVRLVNGSELFSTLTFPDDILDVDLVCKIDDRKAISNSGARVVVRVDIMGPMYISDLMLQEIAAKFPICDFDNSIQMWDFNTLYVLNYSDVPRRFILRALQPGTIIRISFIVDRYHITNHFVKIGGDALQECELSMD